MTLIVCKKTNCVFAKKRSDGLFQCSCTTIGINTTKECDSYSFIPFTQYCTCNRRKIFYYGSDCTYCANCNKQIKKDDR